MAEAKKMTDRENYDALFGEGTYGEEKPDTSNWHPSPWTGQLIDFDPYGDNPMIDALRVENEPVYKMALRGDPIPTMFVGGALPAFTASGMDPQTLMSFPWNQRHAAAAESDSGAVFFMSQEYSTDTTMQIPHTALTDYIARCQKWAKTSGIQRPRFQNG